MAVLESVADALTHLEYEPRDGGAIAIAVKLAQEIDACEDVKLIGELASRLLAVLIALGMTPTSRASTAKGVTTRATHSDARFALDELRSRRERTNGAATVDPTA